MSFKTGLNIKTFEASAILGLMIGYSKQQIPTDQLRQAVKSAAAKVDNYTFSGTFTPTHILVTGKREYEEPAIAIQTSIYPRFPEELATFKTNFIQFIGHLSTALKQERVAIRFTDECLMLETEYATKPDLK